MPWNFDNTYARALGGFAVSCLPEPPPRPELLVWNGPLADELGIPDDGADGAPSHAAIFSGAAIPPGSEPVAPAYAGHQFGHFSPQLGDGRALLLGELVTPDGRRIDLQLKGSGRTPFSRNGDGKCALGPALREYLVSEAMAALGVPTTRSLAVCTTGESVIRQAPRPLPGAVLTRVASSHIRVGTFEFLAAHHGADDVRKLADHAIARHYPAAGQADNRYLAFLEAVMDAQVRLVAAWLNLGFVHGVMNTDNVAISGETLDYGPCAFIDAYDPGACFSSIDAGGRYALANQPLVCRWNMTRLAVALAEVIASCEASSETAIVRINAALEGIPARHEAAWLAGMRAKLGLMTVQDDDGDLAHRLLAAMAAGTVDFTGFFRRLSRVPEEGADTVLPLSADPAVLEGWLADWQARLGREELAPDDRRRRMEAVNPVTIPRNHKVEEALAAAEASDLGPFRLMLEAVSHPFEERSEWSGFAGPAPGSSGRYVTFCGT